MATQKLGDITGGEQELCLADKLSDWLVCGVIILDARQRIESVTEEAQQILGSSAAQLVSQSFKVLPGPLSAIIAESLASGKSVMNRRLEMISQARGPLDLQISAVQMRPGKAGSNIALLLTEMSCAKWLEHNIRQLDRLASLGTLAAGMAHEIRNALVAGKTFIDLVLQKGAEPELAEVVRREMGRIDALVNQMLKFAGPSKPAHSPIHLHDVIEESLRLVESQLKDRAIALHRSYAAAPDLVGGDDYQLEQAFVNLFLNALDAMPPNGELSVMTESVPWNHLLNGTPNGPRQPRLRVTIRDTGTGIRPEDMSHLFEPFFTTKANGTGLGLLITRRIIEEHRGAITVESEPNKGAVFSITLPALENNH